MYWMTGLTIVLIGRNFSDYRPLDQTQSWNTNRRAESLAETGSMTWKASASYDLSSSLRRIAERISNFVLYLFESGWLINFCCQSNNEFECYQRLSSQLTVNLDWHWPPCKRRSTSPLRITASADMMSVRSFQSSASFTAIIPSHLGFPHGTQSSFASWTVPWGLGTY